MPKILLDTDIGGDVDDAVCLAYLLAHPQCELLGITTVAGEPQTRAALASVLCRAAGQEIPIYPGLETTMDGETWGNPPEQAPALSRWPHQAQFPQDQAVEFMRRTIRANPREVILLTIGPLTNAGMLFATDPYIPQLLRGLVAMGGIFSDDFLDKERIEWNLNADPLATEIVYDAPVPLHRSLGLEVTEQVVMQAEDVRRRFAGPLLEPVLDFAEIWFAEFYPFITFHDPLAASTIFEPTLCTYRRGTIAVDRTRRPLLLTFKSDGDTAPHEVAASVDARRYFEHFFAVFQS